MTRVDYTAIAAANAKSAQRSVAANPEGRMAVHPVTGLLMLSQSVAAGLLKITPRAFRDLDLEPDHNAGRGWPTFYYADRIAALSTARALKSALGAGYQPTPAQRVALGQIDRNAEALTAELEPDFEALIAYARAAFVAGHIDEAGAVKVRLLASELHRVLSEHDPEYGHGGALSETIFTPDLSPFKSELSNV